MSPITTNVLYVKKLIVGTITLSMPCLKTARKIKVRNLPLKGGEEVQPIFLRMSLKAESKQTFLDLLREFKEVSTWTYIQMPKLDPITRHINIT